jgi:hypothetical protein
MNDSAFQWLTEHVSPPGTLACGLCRPDGEFICHSVNEAYPVAAIEKLLGDFDALTAAASADSAGPKWITWSFEQGQVRLVERPDGWRFAVVVRNEPTAGPALDSLSQKFLTASLAA